MIAWFATDNRRSKRELAVGSLPKKLCQVYYLNSSTRIGASANIRQIWKEESRRMNGRKFTTRFSSQRIASVSTSYYPLFTALRRNTNLVLFPQLVAERQVLPDQQLAIWLHSRFIHCGRISREMFMGTNNSLAYRGVGRIWVSCSTGSIRSWSSGKRIELL